MAPEKEFALQVLDLGALVMTAMQPTDAGALARQVYAFEVKEKLVVFNAGDDGTFQSDSIVELAEEIVRLTESKVNVKRKARGVAYINIMLPESQFDKYFRKNPNGSVSLYADTFRRVVAQLRKEFKV
jgi:hypothetical protein